MARTLQQYQVSLCAAERFEQACAAGEAAAFFQRSCMKGIPTRTAQPLPTSYMTTESPFMETVILRLPAL